MLHHVRLQDTWIQMHHETIALPCWFSYMNHVFSCLLLLANFSGQILKRAQAMGKRRRQLLMLFFQLWGCVWWSQYWWSCGGKCIQKTAKGLTEVWFNRISLMLKSRYDIFGFSHVIFFYKLIINCFEQILKC